MKIFLLLISLGLISGCALETTLAEKTVIQDETVIKSTKSCANEGSCK
jgi:hypothetical protein|tara:strand:- start:337 stop:480 length:144 start_codon:yes stop_codon:yes gene_type:complete